MVGPILQFLGGLLTWSTSEYLTHRFPMHGRRGSSPLADEHLDHHGHPERTVVLAPDVHNIALKGGAAVMTSLLVTPTFAAGFVTGYAGYTHLHHQIHHRAPRGVIERAVWTHHYRHHFVSPARNFGVTTPLWDQLLGTSIDPSLAKPLPDTALSSGVLR